MDVSVITVNTNDQATILKQIASVKVAAEGVSYEQIISDNGSEDNSIDLIEQEYPEVKIIKNGKNVGFGAANNVAVKAAAGKYFLFLNPDMRMEAGSLKKMVDTMERRREVGVLSCKLTDESGKFNEAAQPRRYPTLFDQAAILLKIPHFFPSVLNNYLYAGFNPDLEQEVDSVRGSCMMLRRELVEKLGWAFDPRYFIWFEDVDTCREAKRLGYKVWYTPEAQCVDYIGQTFKRQSSYVKQRWFTKSMVEFFKKWGPAHTWIILAALRPFALAITYLFSISVWRIYP